jgi:hypothetical protein
MSVRFAQVWHATDVRGSLSGREWIAVVAVLCLAFTTAVAVLLHVGVATLEAALQEDLGVDHREIVLVETAPSVSTAEGRVAVQMFDRALGAVRRSPVMRRMAMLRVPPRDRLVEILGVSAAMAQLQSTVFHEGRWFSAREARDGRPVAVLGRALVDSVYRGVAPRRIRLSRVVLDVIGVAESGALAHVTIDRSIVVPAGLLDRLTLAEGGAPALLAEVSENPRIPGVDEIWRILERRHPRFAGRLSMVSSSQRIGDASRLSAALRAGASGLSAVLVAASLAAVTALMMTIARGHARSVGITRAMGATRAQVVMQGLLIGTMVGAVGVYSGTAVGVVTAQFAPVLFDLPAITTDALFVAVVRAGALPLMTAAGASVLCFVRMSVRAPAELLA